MQSNSNLFYRSPVATQTSAFQEGTRSPHHGSYITEGGIQIHTSDRILHKRCKRKWSFSSPLMRNLAPAVGAIAPLWFGTGFHFAMEDVHGNHRYDSGAGAFRHYASLFRPHERPTEYEELIDMGVSMLDYYENMWLPRRNEFSTLIVDGQPQVEVSFAVPIPGLDFGGPDGRGALYTGTFDRVVLDPHKRYWVVDYKTAARFDTNKLDTDPQISAYTWAASQLYGVRFEGVLYMQFLKKKVGEPNVLKNGELSQAKNQGITWGIYTEALKRKYGKIPYEYVDFVNYLARQESPEGDALIRRDLVRRNESTQRAEAEKIYYEAYDMIQGMQGTLPLYPNPTRDCGWDCPFKTACISMDDGSDFEAQLADGFVVKTERDAWKRRLAEQGVSINLDDEGSVYSNLEGLVH